MVRKVDFCGVNSGKEVDKFRSCDFNPEDPRVISSPMIRECPVSIECAVKDVQHLGSHDMFLGEVLAVHADDAVLDKDGRIDFKKAEPIVYCQGQYWSLGAMLGEYGFSKR